MDKRIIRDYIKLTFALLFVRLYIPHILAFLVKRIIGSSATEATGKNLIYSDLRRIGATIRIPKRNFLLLIFLLHNSSYYRSLFYYRIGPAMALLISWYRPGCKYFVIPYSTKIDEGLLFFHPFSTILNAEKIGKNFTCGHNTTIGATQKGRPCIGDNVSIGVGAIVIGKIKIGNNVVIGAGTVVTKDIPDNCVVVGSPLRIIQK